MRRSICVLVLLITILPAYTSAQSSEMQGEWVSMSARTRGITRIVITRDQDGYSVEAWGKCHPQDCEWGRTVLNPVGKNVQDHSIKAGFAVWEPSFASKHLMLSLDRRMLRVETVTSFRDRSGRASYRIVEYLRRAGEPGDR